MFADRSNWNLDPNRLSAALTRHRAAGRPILDLTASNPTQCGFTYDSETILRSLANPAALTYDPNPRGLDSARQAVAAYYADRAVHVPLQDIFLTTSTSEAYGFAFRTLCNPGEELLIPAPSYPLFDFLAAIHDVRLLPYPLIYDHGWQIDFPELERAITPRTRGVIVVHPNNPTGHFTKPQELQRLNAICAPRQMALIADEVFLDFALGEDRAISCASNQDSLTFTMSGLSKISGLPQMKAAWLITSGPQPLQSQALARLEVIADTYLSMNAPVQWALPALLDQRHSFHKQLMARVRENLAGLDRQLSAQKSCARLAIEGGWYAVLRIPATRSDEDFAVDLLEQQHVCVHPGHFFGFPSSGYLVVSLITPEKEFAEGARRLLAQV